MCDRTWSDGTQLRHAASGSACTHLCVRDNDGMGLPREPLLLLSMATAIAHALSSAEACQGSPWVSLCRCIVHRRAAAGPRCCLPSSSSMRSQAALLPAAAEAIRVRAPLVASLHNGAQLWVQLGLSLHCAVARCCGHDCAHRFVVQWRAATGSVCTRSCLCSSGSYCLPCGGFGLSLDYSACSFVMQCVFAAGVCDDSSSSLPQDGCTRRFTAR